MSYVSSYFHCLFSTKGRQPLIPPPLRDRLWPVLCGIAQQNEMRALEIGGMPDHVHLLLSLPSTLSIAKDPGVAPSFLRVRKACEEE